MATKIIARIKMNKGKSTFTQSEANEIIQLIRMKLLADANTQKVIRNKIRALGFYASDFGIGGGYTEHDFINAITIIEGDIVNIPVEKHGAENPGLVRKRLISAIRLNSDECYILDLCDEVLQHKSFRQHRFEFLRGDAGTMLPVDAYYPELKLVIEYREKQHTEEVKFFDKKITRSGLNRGEQRKKYDELRRKLLPENGFKLIEFEYEEFEHSRAKRLVRKTDLDLVIVRKKLTR